MNYHERHQIAEIRKHLKRHGLGGLPEDVRTDIENAMKHGASVDDRLFYIALKLLKRAVGMTP